MDGFDIEIIGRAAHAGVEPEKGISAIKIATNLINRLPQGRLDEETTFNIGRIEGGTVRNAVPSNLYIEGEFRTSSIETMDNLNPQYSLSIKQIGDRKIRNYESIKYLTGLFFFTENYH